MKYLLVLIALCFGGDAIAQTPNCLTITYPPLTPSPPCEVTVSGGIEDCEDGCTTHCEYVRITNNCSTAVDLLSLMPNIGDGSHHKCFTICNPLVIIDPHSNPPLTQSIDPTLFQRFNGHQMPGPDGFFCALAQVNVNAPGLIQPGQSLEFWICSEAPMTFTVLSRDPVTGIPRGQGVLAIP